MSVTDFDRSIVIARISVRSNGVLKSALRLHIDARSQKCMNNCEKSVPRVVLIPLLYATQIYHPNIVSNAYVYVSCKIEAAIQINTLSVMQ